MIYENLKSELINDGFSGFKTVDELRKSVENVPSVQGVYVVIRKSDATPVFLPEGCCGPHKNMNPNVAVDKLEAKWIDGSNIVYIGMTAKTLKKRVGDYIKAGKGKKHCHWGGRYIWQLADADELIFAWKPLPLDSGIAPKDAETEMLAKFNAHYKALPFANLKF